MSTELARERTCPDQGVGPRVFVTYSHDSVEHKELVREFCTLLRSEAGIDVHLDQWDDDGPRDWSAWAVEQIREADFILAIASPEYKHRTEGLAPADEGRGSRFEAGIIRDQLSGHPDAQTRRILSVVLPGRSIEEIPTFLRPYSTTHYVIDELTLAGIEHLLAALCQVAKYPRPPLGRFVGNPYAELHATLQAEEQARPDPPARARDAAVPGEVNNSGIAFIGQNTLNGDAVVGGKHVYYRDGRP